MNNSSMIKYLSNNTEEYRDGAENMNKKNRFSNLLEQLMTAVELKNYTLAKALQYDVSYISKWVSGRMIPAEKSSGKVLRGISQCIVESASEKSAEKLYQEYLVDTKEELEGAIMDNLVAEYEYVRDLKKNTGSEIAPGTSFFVEMPLLQFIFKMKHPALRKVKEQEIVAAIDILSMEHEYRMMISDVEKEQVPYVRYYPGMHYTLLLNLEIGEHDYVYDTVFFVNMLTNIAHVDFKLYEGQQAYGKIIFTIKDAFAISGMLIESNHCMAVTVSEDPESCNVLYDKVKSLCSRGTLLFKKTSMKSMLNKFECIQSALSTNLRWLIGHMPEHFVTGALLEELLKQNYSPKSWEEDKGKILQTQQVIESILESGAVKILVYDTAFTDFIVSGELDLYNHKIYLTEEQRIEYMNHILSLVEKNDKLEIKLVHGNFVKEFQYTSKACVFLSESISYLRTYNKSYCNNIVKLNGMSIKAMFSQFYDEVWDNRNDIMIGDRRLVLQNIEHYIQSIRLLSRVR